MDRISEDFPKTWIQPTKHPAMTSLVTYMMSADLPQRARWARVSTNPRLALLAAAFIIELAALALWPTLYLIDSSIELSPFG